jgi:hypothetical protein
MFSADVFFAVNFPYVLKLLVAVAHKRVQLLIIDSLRPINKFALAK